MVLGIGSVAYAGKPVRYSSIIVNDIYTNYVEFTIDWEWQKKGVYGYEVWMTKYDATTEDVVDFWLITRRGPWGSGPYITPTPAPTGVDFTHYNTRIVSGYNYELTINLLNKRGGIIRRTRSTDYQPFL